MLCDSSVICAHARCLWLNVGMGFLSIIVMIIRFGYKGSSTTPEDITTQYGNKNGNNGVSSAAVEMEAKA